MNTKKLLFYLLAVLLGGCLPVISLHPLYTEKDVAFEEKMLATWVQDNNESTWEFKRIDDPNNAYKLIFSNKKGQKGSFVGHMVKLENSLFMDLFPDEFPCDPDDPNKTDWYFNAFFLVRAHTFMKIDSVEPQLKMRLTVQDKMEELLKEDPDAVKHTSVEDRLVLTASTKELQQFVLKYADDDRVFTGEIVLNHKNSKDPSASDGIGP